MEHDNSTIMTDKIRWGILGTGRIARAFATGLQEVDDAELFAIGSRSRSTSEKFADEFQVPRKYASYDELTRDDSIDVVYIATPHSLHKDNIIMCLEAGKAVLCEKPFTINAAEAEVVIKLARSKKLFLMEAMWTRYIPAIVKLRVLLTDNLIGDVQVMLCGGAFMPDFDPDFYLFNKDLGGGVLLDAGVYLVSMASMIFGTPEKILATACIGKSGVDEHDACLLQYDNGAIANLYVSLRAKSSPDLTLMGDKGKIYVHPPIFCPGKLTISIYGKDEEIVELPFSSNGYQFEVMEVNRCLREGLTESDTMPLDETRNIMLTMDEIREQINLRYPME